MKKLLLLIPLLALPFTGCKTASSLLTPAAVTSEVATGVRIGLDVYPAAAPEVALARDAICANASNGVVDPQQIVNSLEALGIHDSNTKLIVDAGLLVYETVYDVVGTNNTAKIQPYVDALCAGFSQGLPVSAARKAAVKPILPPHLK